jgi:hypothetical protein
MGLNKTRPIVWNSKLTLAALLVAEGQLTYSEIGKLVNRGEQTISDWMMHPDFKARVEQNRTRLAEEVGLGVSQLAVVKREDRLKRIQTDYEKLQTVRDLRAKAGEGEDDDTPGISTGLVVVRRTTYKDGGTKVEAQIDTGYLSAVQSLEMQAAKELGQLTDPGASVTIKLYGGFDIADV